MRIALFSLLFFGVSQSAAAAELSCSNADIEKALKMLQRREIAANKGLATWQAGLPEVKNSSKREQRKATALGTISLSSQLMAAFLATQHPLRSEDAFLLDKKGVPLVTQENANAAFMVWLLSSPAGALTTHALVMSHESRMAPIETVKSLRVFDLAHAEVHQLRKGKSDKYDKFWKRVHDSFASGGEANEIASSYVDEAEDHITLYNREKDMIQGMRDQLVKGRESGACKGGSFAAVVRENQKKQKQQRKLAEEHQAVGETLQTVILGEEPSGRIAR